jgi:hypothetical protein
MDLDELLHESGRRWRAAQPSAPDYDLPATLAHQQPGWRRPRWRTAAATVALAALVVVFLFDRASTPDRPAPRPDSSTLSADQVAGTWHSTVTVTQARRQHHDLVGDWVLVLDPAGSARLSLVGGPIDALGRWRMVGTQVHFTLPFPGCSSAVSTYQPTLSLLHTGLLELVDVPDEETCVPRALVLDGHWFANPSTP